MMRLIVKAVGFICIRTHIYYKLIDKELSDKSNALISDQGIIQIGQLILEQGIKWIKLGTHEKHKAFLNIVVSIIFVEYQLKNRFDNK